MTDLLSTTWPSLAAAAALGLAFVAIGGPGRGLFASRTWVGLAALAGAAGGLVASWSGLVEGRPGLWLDLAAPLIAAYAAGCVAGNGLRRLLAAGRTKRSRVAGRAVLPSVDAGRPAA